MEGRTSSVRRLIGICAVLALAACSGGGGGDGAIPQGTPLLVRIEAEGAPSSLWEFPGVTPPGCTTGVPRNGRLLFTFNGHVDPASVPPAGPADGAIRISLPGAVAPTVGFFAAADDPALAPGNGRRVVFTPLSPTDLGDPNSGGYVSPATYEVEVRGDAGSGPTITIGGAPLAATAITCFDPCLRPAGAPASTCLADPVPGPPFITETWPSMGFAPPPPIDADALTAGSPLNPVATKDNTITLRISEPLLPTDINLGTVQLVNVASLAQIPGQVIFFQAGTPEAGPDTARIDFVASAALPVGAVFELRLDPLVRDFGDHPVEQIQGVPPAQLRFETQARPFCAQPPLVESFDDDAMLAAASQPSVLTWGGGSLQATYPLEIIGDGSYGLMSFVAGNPHLIDTGMPPVPGFSAGVFDATDLTIAAGAEVRVTGPYPLHIRCTGSVSVAGQIQASAGLLTFQTPGTPNQGPEAGLGNNGSSLPGGDVALGGVGGPGGGAGGRASQDGLQHTFRAEDGFGPPIAGQPDPGGSANATNGGGAGGESGSAFSNPATGLGGAGGSAWSSGGAGQPHLAFLNCEPAVNVSEPIAQATGPTLAFQAPVTVLSAGSGGGGGGDLVFDSPGQQVFDCQGGGGGGGGGGIRISARGMIDIVGAGADLWARGAPGALGCGFNGGGNGGSGSGGMIWLQSFEQINIASQTELGVAGGLEVGACTSQHAGHGGDGLIQLEDADGIINTGFFTGGTQAGANIVTLDFPFGTEVVSQVESTFFDTGYSDPRYTTATLATDTAVTLGTAPGAAVTIFYQAAHADPADPSAPDLTTLTPMVSGDSMAQLDGHRFVRFQVTVSYTSPPVATLNDTFPAIQEISIGYEAPTACP